MLKIPFSVRRSLHLRGSLLGGFRIALNTSCARARVHTRMHARTGQGAEIETQKIRNSGDVVIYMGQESALGLVPLFSPVVQWIWEAEVC